MKKLIYKFFDFEKEMMADWIECFFVQPNIIGKVLLFPIFVFGLVMVPLILPPGYVIYYCLWSK